MTRLNPMKILSSFDDAIIIGLVEKHFEDEYIIVECNRAKQTSIIAESVFITGIEMLLKKLTKPLLDRLEADEEISNPVDTKTRSKLVIISNLLKVIDDRGLAEFFNSKDSDLVLDVAVRAKIEVDGDKEDIIERIEQWIIFNGLLALLECFPASELQNWCNLQEIDCDSTSRRRLANALIYGEDFEETTNTKKRARTPKPSKKKPVIDENINSVDLVYHYTVNELKEFCEANQIKKTGRKRELVNRILKYLRGEDVDGADRDTIINREDDTPRPKKKRKN